MTDTQFVFDTYAILEVLSGNVKYHPYLDTGIIINEFIYAELCYKLLNEKIEHAEQFIEKYSEYISSVNPGTIKEAMQFRIDHKSKNLSMTDCIGYIMSKRLSIKFLTGDKEFESLENVEFVKK